MEEMMMIGFNPNLRLLYSGCCENTTVTVTCKTPGELVPNIENCRKYYKCSNGEPSLQSCPGNKLFSAQPYCHSGHSLDRPVV